MKKSLFTLPLSLLFFSLAAPACSMLTPAPEHHSGDTCHATPAQHIAPTPAGTHALILLLLSHFDLATDTELEQAEAAMLALAADLRADGEHESKIQLTLALEPAEAAQYITPNH